MDPKEEKAIAQAIANEDVQTLSKGLLGLDLYPSQADIVRSIAFDKNKYMAVTAATQYGKTWAVAIGVVLYLLMHENKDILVMSGSKDQAKIVRDKVAEFIAETPALAELVETNATGVDRLKKEASKKKTTFKNGCVLQVLTAGGQNQGQSLMGHGGDLIILDESNLVDDEVYQKRILRMLGQSADSSIVEIGNPTTRNHFYENFHHDDDYKSWRIDWETAVEEGSFTQAFIDKQREKLSPQEFRIQYEAKFPDEDADDTLLTMGWITDAMEKEVPWERSEVDRVVYGLDVAREGNDLSVLVRIECKDGRFGIRDGEIWRYNINNTMKLAGRVYDKICSFTETKEVDGEEKEIPDLHRINVDMTGIGSGVLDRLQQKGLYAAGFKAGASADDRNRFAYQKDEKYFKVRELLSDEGLVLPQHSDLKTELDCLETKYSSKERMRVMDGRDKSPDFADAVMIGLSRTRNPQGGSGVLSYSP